MIQSTLAQLRSKLYGRLGLPVDDTFLDSAAANAAVNDAIQTVDLAHSWPWCTKNIILAESTVEPNDGYYLMPDDYVTMIHVANLSVAGSMGRYLDRRSYDEVRMLWSASGGNLIATTVGTSPIYWAESVHGLILTAPQAAPDHSLLFRYRCTSTPMTADTHKPLHPTRYDEMYIAYGAYLAGLRFRELPETGGALAQYDALFQRNVAVFPAQNFGGMSLTQEKGKPVPAERD